MQLLVFSENVRKINLYFWKQARATLLSLNCHTYLGNRYTKYKTIQVHTYWTYNTDFIGRTDIKHKTNFLYCKHVNVVYNKELIQTSRQLS